MPFDGLIYYASTAVCPILLSWMFQQGFCLPSLTLDLAEAMQFLDVCLFPMFAWSKPHACRQELHLVRLPLPPQEFVHHPCDVWTRTLQLHQLALHSLMA